MEGMGLEYCSRNAGGGGGGGCAVHTTYTPGVRPLTRQPSPPQYSLNAKCRMVHGLLADEGDEFFIQHAYALPDARPDGAAWSREDVTYHEWHAAFGVRGARMGRWRDGWRARGV